MHAQHETLTAEFVSLSERRKNMQLITDQVGSWTNNVSAKLQDLASPEVILAMQGAKAPPKEAPLLDKF